MMDSSTFLIVGANGQLGKALAAQYPTAQCVDSATLDITNADAVASFDWSGITHIINAAAYTNVDGAESTQGRVAAWNVNAAAVANLARVSNTTLIHVSSDYVFDGTQSIHTEDEQFSPLSVYGASKAAGDIAAATNPQHYILRTSWVIGDGNNFVRTMMQLAERDISPTVVHDQLGRLTFTDELVAAINHLLRTQATYGTYNVTNSGATASWADITREIYRILERTDLTVTNTSTEAYFAGKEGIAPRPHQSTLDLAKIQSSGFTPSDWQESLVNYIKGTKV